MVVVATTRQILLRSRRTASTRSADLPAGRKDAAEEEDWEVWVEEDWEAGDGAEEAVLGGEEAVGTAEVEVEEGWATLDPCPGWRT